MKPFYSLFLVAFLGCAALSAYSQPGCMDSAACNFDPDATSDDGSCDYSCVDCQTPVNDECANALPLTSGVTVSGNLCCANPDPAMNPWADATDEHGVWYVINSGNAEIIDVEFWNGLGENADPEDGGDVGIGVFFGTEGCTNLEPVVGGVGFNGNPLDGFVFTNAEFGVGLPPDIDIYICVCTSTPLDCGDYVLTVSLGNSGCTNIWACNYDPTADYEDGSCLYSMGCQDPTACNFQPGLCPGGTCEYMNDMSIQLFLDGNANGIYNAGSESSIGVGSVTIEELGLEFFPDVNGFISVEGIPAGNYTVSFNDPSGTWTMVGGTATVNFPDCDSYYLPLYDGSGNLSLSAGPQGGNAASIFCAFSTYMQFFIQNNGSLSFNADLTISFDDALEYISSQSGLTHSISNGLNVCEAQINLDPGDYEYDQFYISPPPVELIGEVFDIEYHLVVYDLDGNVFYDNTWIQSRTVTCAYDPNTKTGPVGYRDENFILPGEEMEFVIQFQNTGNAPATDVVIHDQIDLSVFDISTLNPGVGSHPFSTVVDNNGLVKFQFMDIMLPDSLSDEPGSHGSVAYRIRSYDNLAFNTELMNTAEIYFDTNPAVITNTTHHHTFDCTMLSADLQDIHLCFGESTHIETELEYADLLQWFVAGNLYATGNSIDLIEPGPGQYTIELVATNPMCAVSSSSTLIVHELPMVSISVVNDVIVADAGIAFEWYLYDQLVEGETGQEFPVANYSPDDYAVYALITDEYGCVGTSNTLVYLGQGIESIGRDLFTLYPNPMSETAVLKMPVGNWNVDCFDALGNCAQAWKNTSGSIIIDRGELASGIYLLSVTGSTGTSVQLKLLVD